MPTSTYEAAARARKTTAMVHVLDRFDVTAEEAERLDDVGWARLAAAAGVRSPSEATRASVVAVLRQRAELADADVFEGLA